jgi:hypothetical protein
MKKGYRRTKPWYELLQVWWMTEVASTASIGISMLRQTVKEQK